MVGDAGEGVEGAEGRVMIGGVGRGLMADSVQRRSLRRPWPETHAREGSRGLKERWKRGREEEGLEVLMAPICLPFSQCQHTRVQSGTPPCARRNFESDENAMLLNK